MKLVTLDRRHRGYGVWKYYIERPYIQPLEQSKITFYRWREWCWTQWGASKELDEYTSDDLFDGVFSSNEHWCWSNNRNRGSRIYLKNDAAATAFTLRWM